MLLLLLLLLLPLLLLPLLLPLETAMQRRTIVEMAKQYPL
jgi:hypothetical protein